MIAYHASNKKFDNFSMDYANSQSHKENFNALWFSTDIEYIKQFGNFIYKVDIKGNFIKEEDFELCDKLCHEFCKINNIRGYKDYGISLLETKHGQKFSEFLLDKGYDGYMFSQNDGETIIVFNPKTVKMVNMLKEELNNNFWNWFKGSKIVDEKGNPLVCYHGTPNAGFEEFKPMSHFTSNKEYADVYQNQGASSLSYKKTADNPQTYAVYLSIKNPFDTRDEKARDIFLDEYEAYYSPNLTDRGMVDWMEAGDLAEWLQENHPEYDGLIIDEGGTGGYDMPVQIRGIAYIPFNANQIKSVDNKGIWSNSNNIYESKSNKYIVYHGTNSDFDVFDSEFTGKGNDQIGSGFYFADNKEVAERYGNNILKCEIEINNPIRLTKEHANLSRIDLHLKSKDVAKIIKQSPDIYDMDETPLWNFEDINGYSKNDLNYVIDSIADEYDDLLCLENDFFRDYPTEFRTAVNKVLGYDGVIQTFDDGNFYVCWFPEQIKILSKESITESLEEIVAYHGSDNKFKKFSRDMIGSATEREEEDYHKSAQHGFFFTSDKEYAKGYGKYIYKCKLLLNNPLVVDMDDYMATDEVLNNFILKAKKLKKDGVIFNNIREVGRPKSTEYLVFYPENIKINNMSEDFNLNEDSNKYIVYHWSPEKFNEFDNKYIGTTNSSTFLEGFYFADKINADNGYIYKCEITLNNPIEIDMDKTYMDSIGVQEAIRSFIYGGEWGYLKDYLEDELGLDENESEDILNRWEKADGVILTNIQYDWHNVEYIVFDAKQIKILEKEKLLESVEFNDNFYKWFGNSKVVDDQGNPLVVYHGTDSEFSVFDNSVNKYKHRQIGAELGYFFTDSEKVARRFIPKRKPKELEIDYSPFSNKEEYEYFSKNIMYNGKELKDKYGEDKFFDLRDAWVEIGNKIYLNKNQDTQSYGLKTCYLRIENPRYIDGEIIGVGEDREYFLLQSKANGYDGVIISNADTGAGIANEYVVFNSNQIKSVDNNGTWSKTSDNIYENEIIRIKKLNEELRKYL